MWLVTRVETFHRESACGEKIKLAAEELGIDFVRTVEFDAIRDEITVTTWHRPKDA